MSLSTRVKTAVMAVTLAVVGAGAVAANTYAYVCPDGHYEATAAECGMHAADTGTTTKELPAIVKDIINGVLYVVGVIAILAYAIVNFVIGQVIK